MAKGHAKTKSKRMKKSNYKSHVTQTKYKDNFKYEA